jgi:CubicO group peptidase (beta-lactamase class C family)
MVVLMMNINDETRFFTHSTGKSITSYIVGHAICEGYISSIDEIIDWPMMSKTLYQGQRLRDLLNMSAGDRHTVDKRSSHIKGFSTLHHRDMDLEQIATLLKGSKKRRKCGFL